MATANGSSRSDATKPEACPHIPAASSGRRTPHTSRSGPVESRRAMTPRQLTVNRVLRHAPAHLLLGALTIYVHEQQGGAAALAVWLAGLSTWVLIRPLGRVFRRQRFVAHPGGRSSHRGFIPLAGGTAIFVPFVLVILPYAAVHDRKLLSYLAGALLLFAVGLWDDRRGLSAQTKIVAQLLAGGLLLAAGYTMSPLGLPGAGTVALGALGAPLLLFWVVLATNAFNIIDGMDGLAAGVGVVALVGLTALGIHPFASAVLAGGLLGFLPWNLARARVFLGDSGSMFVGFSIATLLLELPHASNVALVAALFAYPLGDAGLAALRRFVRGKPIFRGDRSHIHHKLALHLGTTRGAVFAVHFTAAAVMVMGLRTPNVRFLILLLVGWGLTAVALVALGRVRLSRVLGSRRPFRLMHRLRRYLDVRIRLAETRRRCRELARPPREGLEPSCHRGWRHRDPERRTRPPSLHLGPRAASALPRTLGLPARTPGEEDALDAERHAVVHEVLTRADQRLSQLQALSDAAITAAS